MSPQTDKTPAHFRTMAQLDVPQGRNGKHKQIVSVILKDLDKLKEGSAIKVPLAELAEKHNSCLAIENHGDALLNTLDSFKAFTDLNHSPQLGIALAPYHLQAIGASVEDAIRISGKQLFFFYAWQKQPGMNQLPGHGPTDFAPWLKALARVNYRWYVNPFMHGEGEPDDVSDALKKTRAYLEKCATS